MTPNGERLGSGRMFDGIAERYDFVNRVISLGIDMRWRRRAVRALTLKAGARVLDVATGTADLAILSARAEPTATVVGIDPSERMLEIGREKVARQGLSSRIELRSGDAETLPFDDGSFDAVSIAFGIRNVPDRDRALGEMARVTRPGGRVVVLELSEPPPGLLGPICRFHMRTFVPYVGGLISGAKEYKYLVSSIVAFPPADEFGKKMEHAGLRLLETDPLTFGVCHLYVAEPGRAA
jgi:demethylmenaquinone methyltransferase/2-methoxy-6-polyprenyl-1,4-benzoquinol methylase